MSEIPKLNIDNALVYSIVNNPQIIDELSVYEIEVADLDKPSERRAFEFVCEHFEDYGEPPSLDAVSKVCQIELQDPGVDEYWVLSELVKRKAFRKIKQNYVDVEKALKGNDPQMALELLQDFVEKGTGALGASKIPSTIFKLGEDVVKAYEKIKKGESGIELPWQSINTITKGLIPATCTYFLARPGVGKTQTGILIGKHAWEQGKRVLFISPEMSKQELAERLFTIMSKVSASNVIKGELSDFEFNRLIDTISDKWDMDGFWCIDSGDKLSVPNMENTIKMLQPDLVLVDSIYMLDFKGDKTERTTRAIDWMRRASKKFNVPFVGFHQMNRSTVKDPKFGGGYDASNIALSDQLLWDAHAVFIIEQDKDMKINRTIRVHVAKVRRGSWDGKPVDINWDFDMMNFEEIGKYSETGFEDNDKKFDSGFVDRTKSFKERGI